MQSIFMRKFFCTSSCFLWHRLLCHSLQLSELFSVKLRAMSREQNQPRSSQLKAYSFSQYKCATQQKLHAYSMAWFIKNKIKKRIKITLINIRYICNYRIENFMVQRFRKHRLAFITIVYWFLLIYIVAALVWWFIALQNQNTQMFAYKLAQL